MVSAASEFANAQASEAIGKHTKPGDIDAAVAVNIAQSRERQQQHHNDQLISADNLDGMRGGRMEIPRDGWQRHIGDRRIQHRHHQPDEDRSIGPVALRYRHTIGIGVPRGTA